MHKEIRNHWEVMRSGQCKVYQVHCCLFTESNIYLDMYGYMYIYKYIYVYVCMYMSVCLSMYNNEITEVINPKGKINHILYIW